jgi:signal transduction histidine kinase/CheY-like chemotaxis protein
VRPAILAIPEDASDDPPARLVRAIAAASGGEAEPPHFEAGVLAVAPLRSLSPGVGGLLVAFKARRRRDPFPYHAMGPDHLPFLSLLVEHLDRAIESAALTESLRERGEQLATSLAALESTQFELVQAQKMDAVGRLAGGVAHEFNNLLTVILGYSSALRESLPRDAPQQHSVRQIVESGQRAALITRQLLALGRRQIMRRESLDLCELVEKTLELLRRLVGDQIREQVSLDRSVGAVRGDRAQLEQVLLNLVLNARDAMPGGGTMRVTVRAAIAADAAGCDAAVDPAAFAVLEVEDDGVGMDDSVRAHVFEPFFTTKGAGEGSGLGLAVVHGIVKQSEGHILVDSHAGHGSRFTLLWPRASEPAATAATHRPISVEMRSATILLVEDEELIRHVVAGMLEGAGHRVHVAANGEAALRWVEAEGVRPDLLVTDASMPRMGGVSLAAEMRRRWPELPVVIMSGYAEDLTMPGLESSGQVFVQKPFTSSRLLEIVNTALSPG